MVPAFSLSASIAINQGALCIECKACGRRSALTAENCAHIRGSQPASATRVGLGNYFFFFFL